MSESLTSMCIGAVNVTALQDGAADLNGWPVPSDPQPDPPVDWPRYHERFPDGFHGPEHRWRIHNLLFLLETEGKRVLVDCGVGAGPYPWYQGMRGAALGSLAAAQVAPEDIDVVFLTHAHPDHVGWAWDEDARAPRFPNARYLLHEKDWDHFGTRETVPKHFTRFVAPLREAGVLDLLRGEPEFLPGFTALETPGHTAGHMSLLVQSAGEGLVIAGDVLNSPMFLTEPERPFGSDADVALGIRTRKRLVDRIAAEGWRVAAAHFPEPGWGDLVHLEGRRWFSAL